MTFLPTVQVLLDDGTGTFPYDLTNMGGNSYARLMEGFDLKRGRQDELSSPTAGDCTLVLDNTDGRFTVGSTIIASPSPIKNDQRIRIKETLPAAPELNLLATASADFEASIGGWVASGTVLPTLAQDATRFHSGSKSLKITWQGSGSFPQAQVSTAGLTANATYTFAVWVYVPTGAPDVRLVGSSSTGPLSSIKDTWHRLTLTFVQGASTTVTVGIRSTGTPAATICNVDDAMLVYGSLIGDFNTLAAQTFTRFTGYVQSWPTEWPGGGDEFAVCSITATDAQSKAERQFVRSAIDEVMNDGPSYLYRLDEPTGSVVASDSSGSGQNQMTMVDRGGVAPDVVFGQDDAPIGVGGKAATFAGVLVVSPYQYGAGMHANFATPIAAQTLLFAYKTTDPTSDLLRIYYSDGSLFEIGGGGYLLTDGAWHVGHITGTIGASTKTIWVDGVNAGTFALTNANIIGITVGGTEVAPTAAFAYDGLAAHIGAFTSLLSSARIAAQASAILNGFAGEPGTTRLARLAGYANLPVGTLDTSLTNVSALAGGASIASAIQDVADAEFGVAYVDGTGSYVFHNRNRVMAKTTPDITIDANWLAPGTRFEYDMQGVINYFEVIAAGTGVTQVVRNVASEVTNQHGRYPQSKTYPVLTDAEALDRANWTVNTHAEPAARVGSLVVDILTMPVVTQIAMLAAEPDTWLRITGLPGQTPGGSTADFVLQGLGENQAADDWSLTFNAANKLAYYPLPWVLDSATQSVLDSTTRIFV